jgi:hypothetical protein
MSLPAVHVTVGYMPNQIGCTAFIPGINCVCLHCSSFIDKCGGHLIHLRLNSCRYVDDWCMIKVAEKCKDLKGRYDD